MSFNGSGTFSINTAGQPVVTATTISSTAFNALTADLGTGLSTAICKDGQTTCTARIPFAAGINSTLTTDASSISTGSILTAGGIGCAKALWVGGLANIAGAVTLQSTLTVSGSTAPGADNTYALGAGGSRWTSGFFSTAVVIGTNPAAGGPVRIANAANIASRNAANSGDISIIGVNSSDQVSLGGVGGTADLQWTKALVSLGGGAAPTLGTIGGSGPSTAAQNSWMRAIDSTGAAFWVPVWK